MFDAKLIAASSCFLYENAFFVDWWLTISLDAFQFILRYATLDVDQASDSMERFVFDRAQEVSFSDQLSAIKSLTNAVWFL